MAPPSLATRSSSCYHCVVIVIPKCTASTGCSKPLQDPFLCIAFKRKHLPLPLPEFHSTSDRCSHWPSTLPQVWLTQPLVWSSFSPGLSYAPSPISQLLYLSPLPFCAVLQRTRVEVITAILAAQAGHTDCHLPSLKRGQQRELLA